MGWGARCKNLVVRKVSGMGGPDKYQEWTLGQARSILEAGN